MNVKRAIDLSDVCVNRVEADLQPVCNPFLTPSFEKMGKHLPLAGRQLLAGRSHRNGL
jgi:hypothetical protein